MGAKTCVGENPGSQRKRELPVEMPTEREKQRLAEHGGAERPQAREGTERGKGQEKQTEEIGRGMDRGAAGTRKLQ